MCVELTTQKGTITIRPGGATIAACSPGLIDVRQGVAGRPGLTDGRWHGLDGTAQNAANAALQQYVALLKAQLEAEGAVAVQCQEGMSRSPRAAAAYLVEVEGLTVDDAMAKIIAAFRDNQTGDCDQRLSEELVRDWLQGYALKYFPDRAASRRRGGK